MKIPMKNDSNNTKDEEQQSKKEKDEDNDTIQSEFDPDEEDNFSNSKQEQSESNNDNNNNDDNNELEQGKIINNTQSWFSNSHQKNQKETMQLMKEIEDEENEIEIELNDAIEEMKQIDDKQLRNDQEQWTRLTAQYQSSTSRLCKQLRLILEPTLASRLQGDYRTRKRINFIRIQKR